MKFLSKYHLYIIVLLIALLALTSCSLKGLVIPNATYFIADHIGDKYDFYYNQEKEFKVGLDHILKDSTEDLQHLQNYLEKVDIKTFNLIDGINYISPLYYKITQKVNFLLATTFSEFNKDQIANLIRVTEEDNEKILNRTRRDKTDEIAKRFEFFFDKLTPDQTNLIKQNIIVFQEINKVRLNNRLITQKSMIQALTLPTKEERFKMLKVTFDENLSKREPLQNLYPVANFCTKFFKTLNSDQLKFFMQKKKIIIDWVKGFINYYQTQSSKKP